MNPRAILSILVLLLCLLLVGCGNKSDLLRPSEVPPEDVDRYLIKPKPASQPAVQPAPATDDEAETP